MSKAGGGFNLTVIDHGTIAAIATAPGHGGIGVVRVSGNDLTAFIPAICGKALKPRVAALCNFVEAAGGHIDQGLALYFPAPNSYTGEDVLELHGHGGPVVLQQVLKRCLETGARLAEPGEFSKRAFLNNKMDLAQAEGIADLINASTDEAARCAIRSIQGEFSAAIQNVSRQLVELRALTEAILDFPEEEIDAGTREDQLNRLAGLSDALRQLLLASTQGSLLREGARVVLAGQPNAGKSSLLNRLAGEELAIVTDIPGTTRDAIRQSISINGVPMHIIDTAGLRESTETVEQMGIARTWAALDQADLALLVIDGIKGESAEDAAIRSRLPVGLRCITVLNKSDLATPSSTGDFIAISAKTGAGMDVLKDAMLSAIGWRAEGVGVFMARARHLEALHRAQASLQRASQQIRQQELFAEELRAAHEALMSITGEMTPDDLLGEIFSRFCIGK